MVLEKAFKQLVAFIDDIRARAAFENLATLVTKCTHSCVKDYDQMYLEQNEELCVRACYAKSFEF